MHRGFVDVTAPNEKIAKARAAQPPKSDADEPYLEEVIHEFRYATGQASLLPSKKEQDAKRKRYRERLDAMEARIEEAIREAGLPECHVRYSAYPFEDKEQDIPVDNLDAVPLPGKIQIRQDGYVGPVLHDATWLQLCVECNRMIAATGDYHHVFLEDIHVTRNDPDCKLCEFVMGS